MAFLERSTALDRLLSWFQDAASGQGRLVFVSGEMGVGKTTLVDRFTARIEDQARLVQVLFDGLSIPAPLGPLFDVARYLGPNVERLLEAQAPRAQIFRAVEAELRNTPELTVVVAEDTHWSDEASLDLLRFLGRRVGNLQALVIATFRDDELSLDHPLRRVLGDLATVPTVQRIMLAPLSLEAVTKLAGDRDVDPVELHAYTGGNPYYVSEILASGSRVPISLRDAILGRAARLSADDREVLDAAATIGALVDAELLRQVVGRRIEHAVERGLAVGLLQPDPHAIAFRHAAVQSALLTAVSSARRQALHRRILSCLRDHPSFGNDVARLAFHAEEAHDRTAAVCYAVTAATRASAFQSHREAAEQYARALRCADTIEPAVRADLSEAQAYSYYLTARINDAITAQEAAAAIWRDLGRHLEYGHNLRRLSRFCQFASRQHEAERLAEQAYAVLERFPDSKEFALACGYLAEWRLRADATSEAIELGERAMAIANRLDDDATTAHALISVGMVRLGSGDETGRACLEDGLDLARLIGNEEFVLRALTHLAAPPGVRRNGSHRRKYIAEGLAYAHEHDLATKIMLFGSMHLKQLLDNGEWTSAIAEAEELVTNPSATGRYLLDVDLALGLARLRCGQATADEFDRATELARHLEGGAHIGAVDAALAEAAWLKGDGHRAGAIASSALAGALASGDLGAASTLALWVHRSGQTGCDFTWVVEPYALEIAGNWQSAAAIWNAAGMPLEAARARSASVDESDLRAALAEFERIGARPDAARVARRLRDLGFRHVPRGPRPPTRATYGSLTRREVEILSLLSTGSSNRTIARHFFLSPKTIEHHVSAILGKLGVTNRQQAVNRARDVGLIPK